MALEVDNETFVFEAELENKEIDMVTFDSAAGVHVWPANKGTHLPTVAKLGGVKMWAANGTEIPNLGQKVVTFREKVPGFQGQSGR